MTNKMNPGESQGKTMKQQMGSDLFRNPGEQTRSPGCFRARVFGFLLLITLFTPRLGKPNRHLSQVPSITFSQTRFENNFPTGLTFQVTIASAAEIHAVTLFHGLQGGTSLTRVPLTFAPGEEVTLSYTWDTLQITVPPSAPVIYHWEAVDSAGNRASSETAYYYYDDVRYNWQIQEDEDLAVWWHDQPNELGNRVYTLARDSLDAQAQLYQAELTFPVRIIIYNDFEEFAAWHTYVDEFIGGQAFPTLGITTQIVSAYEDPEAWLRDVIPHEISHLYFFQVTDNPFTSPPRWLNEGIAQYNELRSHQAALAYAQDRILRGDLLRLTAITGSFGYDEDEVSLAYAEGLSAVIYLVETYGEQGMGALLAAYKAGMTHDEAFQTALGRPMPVFEQEWLTWLQVPEGMYGTPTPTPVPVLPPMPTMMGLPAPSGTPVAESAQAASPTVANPGPTTGTPVAQAVTGGPMETRQLPPASRPGGRVCAPAAIIILALVIPFRSRVKKRG